MIPYPVQDAASPAHETIQRVDSIDILRGLIILLMIFVNDIAWVTGKPDWMKHIFPPLSDGMTLADFVFPAFLFIVGLSLPFAIDIRLRQAQDQWQVWKHILIRTLNLLIIGVLMVNQEIISDKGLLNPLAWSLLMYIGLMLVWNAPPKGLGLRNNIHLILKRTGIVLLLVMVVLYRGQGEQSFIEIRPYWWGILGLIGWAYLVGCTAYMLLRRNLTAIMGLVAILYLVFMADRGGLFSSFYSFFPWVNIGSMLGSHAAVTLSGVLLGMILMPDSPIRSSRSRLLWGILFGLGLFVAGYLLHTLNDIHRMFIINKLLSTPPWCLISSAYTVWIWAIIYYLIDVRKWKKWAVIFKPAGENGLFAYVLVPVLYALMDIFSRMILGYNFFWRLGSSFSTGFWRSVAFAFLAAMIAGGLRRLGISLKL